jgi:hypothetical protein
MWSLISVWDEFHTPDKMIIYHRSQMYSSCKPSLSVLSPFGGAEVFLVLHSIQCIC